MIIEINKESLMSPEQPQQELPKHPQTTEAAAQAIRPVEDKTDVIGIISIIMPFIGLSLIGLILGLIGAHTAKRNGRSPVVSRVGWILNLSLVALFCLFIIPVFLAVPALQRTARDSDRKNDMSLIQSQLEVFYSKNGYYPASITGLGVTDLSDVQGSAYVYVPAPDGCVTCTSFTLSTTLEKEGSYTVKSNEFTLKTQTN